MIIYDVRRAELTWFERRTKTEAKTGYWHTYIIDGLWNSAIWGTYYPGRIETNKRRKKLLLQGNWK